MANIKLPAEVEKVTHEDEMGNKRTLTVSTLPRARGLEVHIPGSPGHKTLIEAGYGMTMETAQQIIKEWGDDHTSWPWEKYEQAQAMVQAFTARNPQPTSTKPGWRRTKTERL